MVSPLVVEALTAQFMASNYLSAAQLYLKDNFLLTEPLAPEHIKDRQLGHWGSIPGTAFIYVGLNYLIKKHGPEMLFMLGPGHAAPAVLSQLFLEGTLGDFYPDYQRNLNGLGNLLKMFSWPEGFPSHVNPGTPGCILEGGELGYSVATAYGAVLDNPDLIVACVVGDGEAETGPLATAWHSNKFLDPADSGAVLPIVNINGYKISQPTVFGCMSDEELDLLFRGYGYKPYFVDATEKGTGAFTDYVEVLESAYADIRAIQERARGGETVLKPQWPVILLRSLKGWTGIKDLDGHKVEGNYHSHGVPLLDPQDSPDKLAVLEEWLRGYEPQKLFTELGAPIEQVLQFIPEDHLRMGHSKYANDKAQYVPLNLPDPKKYDSFAVAKRGARVSKSTKAMGEYMRDVFKDNKQEKNFRFFCPDETTSNKLDAVFAETGRAFQWPLQEHDDKMMPGGRVMEMLSEHSLQGWMQGYLLTGRHGVLASYEAFIQIIASMVDQHAKFIKQANEIDWRPDIGSANYILSSLGWRQEHNGFSHQNPGFVSNMLDKYGDFISVYFPPDENSATVIMRDCLQRKNSINIIVAGKRKLPQWLSIEEAQEQLQAGLMVWDWAGNQQEDPHVVLSACGDYMTLETMAAVQLLKEVAPDLATRFVSVSELTCLGLGDERHPCTVGSDYFNECFTDDKPILMAFHGYPIAIKKLFIGHPAAARLDVCGYIDEGSTTTPFDMQLVNETSRYHIAIRALRQAAEYNSLSFNVEPLISRLQDKIELHKQYILATGSDPDEIVNWEWQN